MLFSATLSSGTEAKGDYASGAFAAEQEATTTKKPAPALCRKGMEGYMVGRHEGFLVLGFTDPGGSYFMRSGVLFWLP